MGAVKLPGVITGSMTFEHILSITVLEWQVILVGCKIKGLNRDKRIKKFVGLIRLIITQ